MPDIYIHHYKVLEDILGPGKRLVIWTTGCEFKCDGCIEEKLQNLEYGKKYSIIDFYTEIKNTLNFVKAVTFTGGEPLFQKKGIIKLIELFPDKTDIMLFSGMNTDDFYSNCKDLFRFIDILVSEPFIQEKHNNHLWRGSTNQKITSPSGKYDDKSIEWMHRKSKGIQVNIESKDAFIYGIPVPKSLNQVYSILKDKGINLT